ncbi:MAG: XdhC family protein [Phycisphaerae bacterium]|nr:XdhC family protein [Phycisphaerae bacterium]
MTNIYSAIVELIEAGQTGVLATLVAKEGSAPQLPGAKMLVRPDGSIVGTVGGGIPEKRACQAAAEVLCTGKAQLITINLRGDPGASEPPCGGRVTIFVEPIATPHPLLIFGAGHVGAALTKLAADLGFRVTVIDERPEFARLERLPGAADVKLGVGPDVADQLRIDDRTFMVIVTHGHANDEEVLRWVVASPARYIGMMASRRKVKTIIDHLESQGIPREQLDRVHKPIGLDIGAISPTEIAVSIAAEMIAVLRGPKGC